MLGPSVPDVADAAILAAIDATSIKSANRYKKEWTRLRDALGSPGITAAICDTGAAWEWARSEFPDDSALQWFVCKIRWPLDNMAALSETRAREFWSTRTRELVAAQRSAREQGNDRGKSGGPTDTDTPTSSDVQGHHTSTASIPVPDPSSSSTTIPAAFDTLAVAPTCDDISKSMLICGVRRAFENAVALGPPLRVRVVDATAANVLGLGSPGITASVARLAAGSIAAAPEWFRDAMGIMQTGSTVAAQGPLGGDAVMPKHSGKASSFADDGSGLSQIRINYIASDRSDTTAKMTWTGKGTELAEPPYKHVRKPKKHVVNGLETDPPKFFRERYPWPEPPLLLGRVKLRSLLEDAERTGMQTRLALVRRHLAEHEEGAATQLRIFTASVPDSGPPDDSETATRVVERAHEHLRGAVTALDAAERDLASRLGAADVNFGPEPPSDELPRDIEHVDAEVAGALERLETLEAEVPGGGPDESSHPLDELEVLAAVPYPDSDAGVRVKKRILANLALARRHAPGPEGTASEHGADVREARRAVAMLRAHSVILSRLEHGRAERELSEARSVVARTEGIARVALVAAEVQRVATTLRSEMCFLEDQLAGLPSRDTVRYRAGLLARTVATMNEFFDATVAPESPMVAVAHFDDIVYQFLCPAAHGNVCARQRLQHLPPRHDVTLLSDRERVTRGRL
jgi:hypothetical protein